MGEMTTEQQIHICERLSKCSIEQLGIMMVQAGIVSGKDTVFYRSDINIDSGEPPKEPPKDFLGAIVYQLRKNSNKVIEIIQKYHNDIATMVYSLGLIAGNQYIVSGDVNRMTLVYTVLMYLAKVGFDKVLAGSK